MRRGGADGETRIDASGVLKSQIENGEEERMKRKGSAEEGR